jgi:hypothetical protein
VVKNYLSALEDAMKSERRIAIDPHEFLTDYVMENRPVIVTGAMDSWSARTKWGPEYLISRFGDQQVQIYNDFFDLVDVASLKEYLKKNFGKPAGSVSTDYVRWFMKFKECDFIWADEVFGQLQDDWHHPSFLPVNSFVLPFCPGPDTMSISTGAFPYKGMFISGAGARTRLHRDPWTTEALICQFYGSKKITLYAPDQDCYLRNGLDVVDPQAVDTVKFPHFKQAQVTYEDVLAPGEILYTPSNWLHDVTSLTDSISVTMNFLHACRLEQFLVFLKDESSAHDRELITFFLRPWLNKDSDVSEIASFLSTHFQNAAPVAKVS